LQVLIPVIFYFIGLHRTWWHAHAEVTGGRQ